MSRYRHAIVIGGSSGIGAALVRQLAADGVKVAAVARREDRLATVAAASPENIRTYLHDVSQPEEAAALFQKITGDLGGLDLLIYAAGTMPVVGPEEFDFPKDQAMVMVNCTGAVAWLNQAAIRFGNVGSGTIVAIGSVAGDRGRAGQPVYNASKAFLATYMEALRNRLAQKGITVVTVKPGPVSTEMTAHLDPKGFMSAEEAAKGILHKSQKSGEYYLKLSHRIIFWVIRHIPSSIFRRMKL